MQNSYQSFHVGINIFVVKDDKLLLGKRKNVYGAGAWGLPGGHFEAGEAMKDAAARELMEEAGLSAENFDFSNIVNDRSGGQHYLQIGFVAKNVSGEAIVKESDRCQAWEWFKFGELPRDLFPPHRQQVDNFLNKLSFFDA